MKRIGDVSRTIALAGVSLILATTSGLSADPPPATGDAPRVPLEKMLPDLHLLEPIWRTSTVYRESVVFVQDAAGEDALGKLVFPAEEILAVQRADGAATFQAGRDFKLADDKRALLLTKDSPIPRLAASDLFPPKGAPRSIPHKTGDPARHVLFDNAHWFHDQQVEVTYRHTIAPWPAAPAFAGAMLPKTLARLREHKKLTLAVRGDSISQGYNASGYSQAPPWMPPYPDLVAAQLRHTYATEVELQNRAIGGWSVGLGLKDLDALLAGKPNLVIIAYGMNDVGGRNPEAFRSAIAAMLEKIHQSSPEIEVILVATMLGNADWVHTPREMFAKYRDALASLTGRGVALADLTSLWQELLKHKREVDLTGNGVNHPSDFGHRLYAQVILALLVERGALPSAKRR
jgi:lysophospholipase L1-like esterase